MMSRPELQKLPLLTGYEPSAIFQDFPTLVCRATRSADHAPVVIKALADRAEPSAAALRREWEILAKLRLSCTLRVYELIDDERGCALIMADEGAQSLRSLGLCGTLSIAEFLELASEIAGALAALHGAGVIHKDLNPSNIVAQPGGKAVRFIDFGIATLLSEETVACDALEAVEGTLAYMSPEQTGRMNRPVDYRTDYYALGVTLFELLTGRLPFEFRDAIELVHAQLALTPPSAAQLRPGVPQVLADMIAKLLSKEADERYQSLAGFAADLSRCRGELERKGQVAQFPLGAEDRSPRFRFAPKLYGRAAQVQVVADAFQLARQAKGQVVLVAGEAGIGKTAIMREVYRPLTRFQGYFAACKFDVEAVKAPYSAFAQLLSSLGRQLASENDVRITDLRRNLTSTIDAGLTLLLQFCPDLSRVLGHSSASLEAPGSERRKLLPQVIRDFLVAVARSGRPLCLLFDDVQWADIDSLKLLEELVIHTRDAQLLCLAAHRPIEATHPFTLSVQSMREMGAAVTRIEVPAIGPHDVEELLADALSMPRDAVRDLAALVHARTGGNPFFVRLFVKTLVEDEALRFGPNGWAWSMTELRERGVTENIAKVLSNQIRRLPDRTHTLLELAACLGSQFPLETLKRVEPRLELETDLWPAIDSGYLIPAGYIHSPADLSGSNLESSLRFAHDRVREAILGRLPPLQREALHRQIAGALANHPRAAEGPMLFELVGQLNQSGDPPSSDERLERARLNLLAATRSIAASSAQRALSYATTGIDLLRQGTNAEPLRHELQTTACEAAFSCGKFDTFTDLAQQALSQPLAPLEEARILGLAGHVAYARGDGLRALETYLRALTSLGFWPAEPLSSQAEVAAICALSDEQILSLPPCADARALLGTELLDPAILTAFYAGSAELPALLNLCCGLSLRFGLTPYSAFAFTILGVLELGQDRFESAMRLAQLALAIAERFGNDEISSRILLYTHYQLLHRRLPLRDQVSPLRRAYQFGAKAGSAFNAGSAAATLCIVRFLAGGEELRSLTRDMAAFADRVRLLRQNQVLNWLEPYEQTVWNLVQDTPEPARLHGPVYDERERSIRHLANNDAPALFNLRFCKAYLAYLFGDYQEAYRVSAENAAFLDAVAVHTLMIGPALLLDALSRLAVAAELSPERRDQELLRVRATLQTFEGLRSECASNSQQKYHLIAAELARVEGRHEAARDHFMEAMSAASRSGNYAEEALTHEVSARFFLASRDPEAARAALRTAHDAYLRWGATTKVKMLEGEHPQQLPNLPWGTLNTSTLATIHRSTRDFNWLDVLSALHASQTISREMSVDRLIVSLMDLVVGTAGAELGYLFVNQADGWVVQADKPGPQEPSVLVPLVPLETHALTKPNGLPTSILQHVIATKEPLVLDDAATHEVFGYDNYVASRAVKSVLCFPLLRQGELVCAVYLENNLVRTAFSPSRVLILEFLAGQALISLENARLYATLEQKVQQRTQQLRRKNEELAQALDQLKEAQNCIIVQDRLASLGAMTAGLAHELRNPLNFVQNFARLSLRGAEQMISRLELLGATPTPEDSAAPRAAAALHSEVPALLQSVTRMKGNLEKVTLHGDRIDGLIRSMLDHSRSNTGPRRDTDINALLETYANLAQHGSSTQDARLNVVLELDRSIEPLPIVPQELGRVFLNLIDNARYATHKKSLVAGERDYSPTLRLSTRNCGAHVEIRVRDNGTGIEKSVQSRIFDPFFTTKPTGQGTGLGLSISHDIVVQANGGSLRFESEEGEFTEFIIALPKRPVTQSATGRSP